MRRRHEHAGFTLVELLISMGLTFLIVLFLTQSFGTQRRAYTVVDNVAEMQQNLRAISDLLERELRLAGLLVPEAAAVCGVDQTNASDAIFISDGDAIAPAGQTQLGIGAEITAGFVGGGGTDVLTVDDVVIDGSPFYDTTGDGVADSDFRTNAGGIVVDRANPDRGAACGVVTVTSATTLSIDYDPAGGGSLAAVPPGGNIPDLVIVPAHHYRINGTNQLMRDGMVLADAVEDLQFALFYDVDGDGLVASEALEYPGAPLGNPYVSSGWNNEDLREIRVNIVIRTENEDAAVVENANFAQGEFQITENRVAPGGANDGFRRRVMTSTVRPRNVGARGI